MAATGPGLCTHTPHPVRSGPARGRSTPTGPAAPGRASGKHGPQEGAKRDAAQGTAASLGWGAWASLLGPEAGTSLFRSPRLQGAVCGVGTAAATLTLRARTWRRVVSGECTPGAAAAVPWGCPWKAREQILETVARGGSLKGPCEACPCCSFLGSGPKAGALSSLTPARSP